MLRDKARKRIIFLIGCLSQIPVDIVGRMYAAELIIFIMYFLYPETRPTLPPCIKKLRGFMYLWLASQLVTDIYRSTPLVDTAKGAISIIFLILLLPFMTWMLSSNIKNWIYYYFGGIVSSQLNFYLFFSQTEFGAADIWQAYAYAPLFSGFAVYLYSKGKYYHNIAYIVYLLFGVWILFQGSRNVFLTSALTTLLLYLIDKYNSSNINSMRFQYQKKIWGVMFALTVGLFAVSHAYEFFASHGYLGDKAYEKYWAQKNNDLGLVSGRIETIMDIDLISKSPIIGYGSYAKDTWGYKASFMREHGLRVIETDKDEINMLPRHSAMFGTTMWHGLGCGVFWIFILLTFYRSFRSGYFITDPAVLMICVSAMFSSLWNTFFSPFAGRLGYIIIWVYLLLSYNHYIKVRNE